MNMFYKAKLCNGGNGGCRWRLKTTESNVLCVWVGGGGGGGVHLNKAPGERGSADKGAIGTVI